MSVSLAIPAVTHVTAAGLSGVAGPLLTDANSQSAALPVIAQRNRLTSETSTPIPGAVAAHGLDPLTPSTATTREAAALTKVLDSITSTLATVQSSTGQSVSQSVSQLLQSQGFLLLFHVLGADAGPGGTGSETVSARFGDLLAATSPTAAGGTAKDGSTTATATTVSSAATTGLGDTGTTPDSAPYFQKLLGELAGTFAVKSAPHSDATTADAQTSFTSSELDLFLKWLSLNGSGSLVASA